MAIDIGNWLAAIWKPLTSIWIQSNSWQPRDQLLYPQFPHRQQCHQSSPTNPGFKSKKKWFHAVDHKWSCRCSGHYLNILGIFYTPQHCLHYRSIFKPTNDDLSRLKTQPNSSTSSSHTKLLYAPASAEVTKMKEMVRVIYEWPLSCPTAMNPWTGVQILQANRIILKFKSGCTWSIISLKAST